ncbi:MULTISPECIES: ComEA family DNA-binding protein [Gordonia]|uniref:ComEA family DNA-binding protein n=1 Tax=Gordonia TaxID=2053 RepID=UPI0003474796|nr:MULTISPECIES: ComEA family DNA-binding protein [Gordonia]ATD71551.1 competence protein ComEA [Gordonia sp. 1D]MBA5849396.1 ComEA family DNA-binding protein [Gordonia amicalis]MDV7099793.1 ComEA family DNA-binding protein [Gordonia amicalis]MDV7171850.1 ComEA family DNA-binding protein [Gordonia amicalis]NKX78603.1 ComEA family DNA-binding protein [Gordonia amicalis]
MSASGRRNPLDRLGPVVERPASRDDLSPAAAGSDPPPGAGDPAAAAVAVEEPEHPGWGIGGMPTWLDAPPPTSPTRGHFDDVLDPDDDRSGEDRDEDEDPVPRRRFAVAPPAAIALIAVGVIACVVAGFGLFRGTDSAPVVDFGATAGSSSMPDASVPPVSAPPSTTPARLVVSVVGLVNRPGLVRLAPGARVAEAIDQAGGPRKGADLLSLNLARILRDGDQILVGYAAGEGQMSLRSAVVGAEGGVPAPGPSVGRGSPPPASSAAEPGGRVNLNTATEAELDALPGVGPVTAKAILDWRERNGRFTSVDQLAEVDGIGPARLAKLVNLVTV